MVLINQNKHLGIQVFLLISFMLKRKAMKLQEQAYTLITLQKITHLQIYHNTKLNKNTKITPNNSQQHLRNTMK